VTTSPQPAHGHRAGRQLAPNRNKAAALHALQQQAAAAAPDLRDLVNTHLRRQRHYGTTADLIDLIITRYPDCPKFASLLVDRLMAGDEALADALKGLEGI